MSITATEFKTNFGKYLMMAATEDIYITKNGQTIAKLTAPYQNKLDTVNSLFGSVPDTMTLEEALLDELQALEEVRGETEFVPHNAIGWD